MLDRIRYFLNDIVFNEPKYNGINNCFDKLTKKFPKTQFDFYGPEFKYSFQGMNQYTFTVILRNFLGSKEQVDECFKNIEKLKYEAIPSFEKEKQINFYFDFWIIDKI